MIKNTFWLTGGEIIGRALRVILILVAARILGAAPWGIFSYILSIAALFTIAADLGLAAVLTRELVRRPEKETQYLAAAFWLKLIFILAAALLILTLLPLFTNLPLAIILLALTAALVISDGLRLFVTAVNRAREKMRLEAIINIFTQLMILLLGLGVLLQTRSLEALTISYVIGSALGTLLGFWTIRQYLTKIFSAFNKELAQSLVSAAWPFALVGLLGALMLNTDIVMLGWLRSAEEIGYYSAGQKIVFVLYVLPNLIAAAVFPSLARLAHQKDKIAFAQMLARALKLVFLLALPLIMGGLILASPLIINFYGQPYTPAISAFQILLVSLLVNYPLTVLGNALFAYDRQLEFLKFSALGAGANIIFNALLIPGWGIEGAALATLISQVLSNALIWWQVQQVNQFVIFRQLGRIGLATLVMGALLLLLQTLGINFFLMIATAILTYFLCLYLIKEEAVVDLKKLLYAAPS